MRLENPPPFELLSDADLAVTDHPGLSTFAVDGKSSLERLTLVLSGGQVEHVFNPVFPPDEHAAAVLRWFERRSVE